MKRKYQKRIHEKSGGLHIKEEDFEEFEIPSTIIYSLKMFCNLSDDTITIAVDEKLTLNVAILFFYQYNLINLKKVG